MERLYLDPISARAPPHHKKNQYSFYMTRAFEREENFTKYHFVVNKILHPGAIFGPPGYQFGYPEQVTFDGYMYPSMYYILPNSRL